MSAAVPGAAVPGAAASAAGLVSVTPRWRRIELALGLELHLREDASDRVLALAELVAEAARGGGGGGGGAQG